MNKMQHVSIKELQELANYEGLVPVTELRTLFPASDMLSPFVSKLVATLFDLALEKMVILRGMFRSRGCYPQVHSILFRSIKDRCESRSEEDGIPLEDINYYKLQREINALMLITREASSEVIEYGTFLNASDMLHIIIRMMDDNEELIRQEPINKKAMLDLRSKLAKEKDFYNQEIDRVVDEITSLKFELEDVKTYNAYELQYLLDYEDARIEQNNLLHDDEEKTLTNFIREKKIQIQQENHIHALTMEYIEESKNDYQEEIEYWMKHYDKELEKRDKQIISLKTSIEKMQEEMIETETEFENNKKFIEDWLEYARIRDNREEQEALEQNAAEVIQIWWRYMMKKKGLGPYVNFYGKGKKGKGKKK